MFPSSGKPAPAFFDAPMQTLAPDALATRRAQAVARLLRQFRGAGDSFYRDRWAAEAPSARDRAPGESLHAVGITTGDDLAAEVAAHPPFGRLHNGAGQPIRTGLALAAVPRPMPIYWTRADLDAEAAWGARALWRAGVRPRRRTSDCLEGGLVTPGTLAISDALDHLDALALPVGPITTDAALQRALEVWDIVQPECLIVDAPTFAFLDPHARRPRCPLVVMLGPADADLLRRPPRPDLFRIFSMPQLCTFAAGECAAHEGYHIAEDSLAAEVIDRATGRAPGDAQPGGLLLTTLTRHATVLRFETGLRATLTRAPGACGETHARIVFS